MNESEIIGHGSMSRLWVVGDTVIHSDIGPWNMLEIEVSSAHWPSSTRLDPGAGVAAED